MKRERGFLLVVAVLVLVVVAVAVVALGNMVSADIRASSGHAQSQQAYFVALSGLERATRASVAPPLAERITCATMTGNANLTAIPAGPGRFTVTGGAFAYPVPSTLPAGGVSAVAAIIPVASTAGYSAQGRIMIDRELIDYRSLGAGAAVCGGAAACFLGVQRGAAGTLAAAHSANTRVGQFQCDVQASGGVPDLVAPQARRVASQGTQLQEGWAVGLQGGVAASRPWMLRFQEATWTQFNAAAINVNAQLNAVSMLSYADGFAVGDPGAVAANRPFVMRWTGAAWAPVNTGLAINRALSGVSCVAANDCWAVGAAGAVAAQRPWIIRWNGAAWSNNNAGVGGTNVGLNKVHCSASNDCWAVGNASGGEYMIRWNGAAWARVGPIAAIPDTNLNAVHCLAANACWAVGNAAGGNEVIVRWQGGPNWTRMGPYAAVPNVNLSAVHCVDALNCWAVGAASGGNVNILRWNGATWSPAPALVPAVNRQLNSISCVNANDCWAVGNSDGLGELVLKWDGVAWARVGPSGALDNRNLLAVQIIGAARRAQVARREIYP